MLENTISTETIEILGGRIGKVHAHIPPPKGAEAFKAPICFELTLGGRWKPIARDGVKNGIRVCDVCRLLAWRMKGFVE